MRSTCKDCGGGSICQHQQLRSQCKDCRKVTKSKRDRYRRGGKEWKGELVLQGWWGAGGDQFREQFGDMMESGVREKVKESMISEPN